MPLVINGEDIPDDEVATELQRMASDYEQYAASAGQAPDYAQLQEWARENVIERVLIRQEALRQDLAVDEAEIASAVKAARESVSPLTVEQLVEVIRSERKVDALLKLKTAEVELPSEEELRAAFTENQADMMMPEQVQVSYIRREIHCEHDYEQVIEELQRLRELVQEGQSFEEVANAESMCPDDHGDLGWVPRGQLAPEFEDIVFSLQPGVLSEPFASTDGGFLVTVKEHLAERPLQFDEVRERLSSDMLETRRLEAIHAFVDSLKSRASILSA